MREVERLATTASTTIPAADKATWSLTKAYRKSALAGFHEWFYSEEHDAADLWPETYDLTSMDMLPPSVRHILEQPNPLLLRPSCVRLVVRTLLSLGWHPRHIAGLVRSKYERDYGWDDQWSGYDPATRADFYARVFAGEFVTGLDELIDFNGKSIQEEGLNYEDDTGKDFEQLRKSLLDRKKYERLASWPINGLFLPEKHL